MKEISEPRYSGKQNKRDGDQLYHLTLKLRRVLVKATRPFGPTSAYPPTAAREQTFRDRRFGPISRLLVGDEDTIICEE